MSQAPAVNQQRGFKKFRKGVKSCCGTYRLVTSLLGLLLVLLGLFIASLCFSVQKMSVNVSDGCASSHQRLFFLLLSFAPQKPLTRLSAGGALGRRLGL